jgi:hypothetical protein
MGDLHKTSDYTLSTNGYVSLLKARIPTQGRAILIHLMEDGTNDILHKVLGSTDDVTYFNEIAEDTLASGDSIPLLVTNPWVYLDVQIMSAAPDTAGNAKAVMVVG